MTGVILADPRHDLRSFEVADALYAAVSDGEDNILLLTVAVTVFIGKIVGGKCFMGVCIKEDMKIVSFQKVILT